MPNSKVYVLSLEYAYEAGGGALSVHKTLEGAKAAAEKDGHIEGPLQWEPSAVSPETSMITKTDRAAWYCIELMEVQP